MADALGVVPDFFRAGHPVAALDTSGAHFRSLRSTSALERDKALAFAELVLAVRPVQVRSRECVVCGSGFVVRDSRDKTTCSEACWGESKVRAAGKRSAQKDGEPLDFERTPRPPGAYQVRFDELAELHGIGVGAMQSRITRGRHRQHDGREHGVKFWWVNPQSRASSYFSGCV